MIFAAGLIGLAILILVWLAWDCWKSVRRPRNRYRKGALPQPSSDCARFPDWRAHTPNTRY